MKLPGRLAVTALATVIACGFLVAPAEAKPKCSKKAQSGHACQHKRTPRPAQPTPAPSAQPAAAMQIASTIPGCFNLSTDMGRPVCEVANALGVPVEVFREAFTHVTPATSGSEPSDAQREANHQALLSRLAPYGVTAARLDAVSDQFRLT